MRTIRPVSSARNGRQLGAPERFGITNNEMSRSGRPNRRIGRTRAVHMISRRLVDAGCCRRL